MACRAGSRDKIGMSDAPQEPIKVYLRSMEDIKARLLIVKRITQGFQPLEGDGLNGEIVCLMLRKVLEQIAFASLAAHKDAYTAVHSDADYTWRAKRLLERLAEIHPNFYPLPLRRSAAASVPDYHHFDNVEDFLTQDEFVFLYDTASGGLHTWNPYKSGPRVLDFKRSIAEWVQRIERLLDTHFVRFLGSTDSWLIQMDNAEDHKVHGYKTMEVDPESSPPHVREAMEKAGIGKPPVDDLKST